MFGLPMNSRGNINQLLSEVIDATIQENELLFSKMPDFIIQSKRFMWHVMSCFFPVAWDAEEWQSAEPLHGHSTPLQYKVLNIIHRDEFYEVQFAYRLFLC